MGDAFVFEEQCDNLFGIKYIFYTFVSFKTK